MTSTLKVIKNYLWNEWGCYLQKWNQSGPMTALHNPRGALDLEWLFRNISSWAQMAWPLISHTVLSLNMGPHSSQRNPWRDWELKAVSSKHSQEIGQQTSYWRSNLAVYHKIHHRPLLKLSIRLLSIQIQIILPTCLELYWHICALKITLWPHLLPHPLPKRKIIL